MELEEFTQWIRSLKKKKVQGQFLLCIPIHSVLMYVDRLVESQTPAVYPLRNHALPLEDVRYRMGHH